MEIDENSVTGENLCNNDTVVVTERQGLLHSRQHSRMIDFEGETTNPVSPNTQIQKEDEWDKEPKDSSEPDRGS